MKQIRIFVIVLIEKHPSCWCQIPLLLKSVVRSVFLVGDFNPLSEKITSCGTRGMETKKISLFLTNDFWVRTSSSILKKKLKISLRFDARSRFIAINCEIASKTSSLTFSISQKGLTILFNRLLSLSLTLVSRGRSEKLLFVSWLSINFALS